MTLTEQILAELKDGGTYDKRHFQRLFDTSNEAVTEALAELEAQGHVTAIIVPNKVAQYKLRDASAIAPFRKPLPFRPLQVPQVMIDRVEEARAQRAAFPSRFN